ncbi:unnamed protein product [Effrenium voratum]|nr:unnamed protein product [Effrenium voratum]
MEDLETSLTSRLPARSRWVGSLTAAGLSVCDDKTKTIEASLAGSSKWEKLTSSFEKLEGAKSLKWEKSLAGTSKLVPHLEPELHEEVTVRFGRTGTMKEALAVLQEAAEERRFRARGKTRSLYKRPETFFRV